MNTKEYFNYFLNKKEDYIVLNKKECNELNLLKDKTFKQIILLRDKDEVWKDYGYENSLDISNWLDKTNIEYDLNEYDIDWKGKLDNKEDEVIEYVKDFFDNGNTSFIILENKEKVLIEYIL